MADDPWAGVAEASGSDSDAPRDPWEGLSVSSGEVDTAPSDDPWHFLQHGMSVSESEGDAEHDLPVPAAAAGAETAIDLAGPMDGCPWA